MQQRPPHVSGIDVDGHLSKFTLLSGLDGVVTAARVFSGQPTMGMAYERDAIAAAVIGRVFLPKIIYTYQNTMANPIIISAVMVDQRRRMRKNRT